MVLLCCVRTVLVTVARKIDKIIIIYSCEASCDEEMLNNEFQRTFTKFHSVVIFYTWSHFWKLYTKLGEKLIL